MGEQKPPEWYDEWYRNAEGWPTDVLTKLHEECARAIREEGRDIVYDFGCGPGWFAFTLHRCGFRGLYLGVDTSQEAVRRGAALMHPFPNAHFRSVFQELDPDDRTIFVFIEVLEHIEDDIATFEEVAGVGARVLITLPTFDSESHVRHFKPADDIAARYGLIDARQWTLGQHILCMGTRA